MPKHVNILVIALRVFTDIISCFRYEVPDHSPWQSLAKLAGGQKAIIQLLAFLFSPPGVQQIRVGLCWLQPVATLLSACVYSALISLLASSCCQLMFVQYVCTHSSMSLQLTLLHLNSFSAYLALPSTNFMNTPCSIIYIADQTVFIRMENRYVCKSFTPASPTTGQ